MRALIREAGAVRLVEVPAPVASPGDVLVRVLVAGICRTDLHVASGTVPSADPITLGHELCGRVLDTRALVTVHPVLPDGFLGVTHHGAFADIVRVPAANVIALPAVDPRIGAYTEPVAAALAVPAAIEARAARIAVFGDNRFAQLVERVLRLEGFAARCITAAPREAIDVGVETSGTAEELALLIEALRPGGLLVLKSRHPGRVPLPLARIVEKQLVVRGVQYGSFARAVELLAGPLDVRDLLGEVTPIERWAEAFAMARAGEARKQFLQLGDDPCAA
jgi:L-iditol 2-dehydrogenase